MHKSEERMAQLETSILSISNNLNNLVQHLSKRQRIEDSSDNEHWDEEITQDNRDHNNDTGNNVETLVPASIAP